MYGEVRGGFLEGAGLEEKGTCGGSGLGRLKDYAGEPGQRTRGTVRPGRGGVDIISRWTPLLPTGPQSLLQQPNLQQSSCLLLGCSRCALHLGYASLLPLDELLFILQSPTPTLPHLSVCLPNAHWYHSVLGSLSPATESSSHCHGDCPRWVSLSGRASPETHWVRCSAW